MRGGVVFVVQEIHSGYFLCPAGGDVGYTRRLREAGTFATREEAIETAVDHCDEGFDVVAIVSAAGRA